MTLFYFLWFCFPQTFDYQLLHQHCRISTVIKLSIATRTMKCLSIFIFFDLQSTASIFDLKQCPVLTTWSFISVLREGLQPVCPNWTQQAAKHKSQSEPANHQTDEDEGRSGEPAQVSADSSCQKQSLVSNTRNIFHLFCTFHSGTATFLCQY